MPLARVRTEPRPATRTGLIAPDQVGTLPLRPGVYLFYGGDGRLLYIGKATRLRHRVRSYYRPQRDAKTRALVSYVVRIAYRKTASEAAALALETRCIRIAKPPFNVRARERRGAVWLRIAPEDPGRTVALVAIRDAVPGVVSAGPVRAPRRVAVALHTVRRSYVGLEDRAGNAVTRDARSARRRQRQFVRDLLALVTTPTAPGAEPALLRHLRRAQAAAVAGQQFERAAALHEALGAVQPLHGIACPGSAAPITPPSTTATVPSMARTAGFPATTP